MVRENEGDDEEREDHKKSKRPRGNEGEKMSEREKHRKSCRPRSNDDERMSEREKRKRSCRPRSDDNEGASEREKHRKSLRPRAKRSHGSESKRSHRPRRNEDEEKNEMENSRKSHRPRRHEDDPHKLRNNTGEKGKEGGNKKKDKEAKSFEDEAKTSEAVENGNVTNGPHTDDTALEDEDEKRLFHDLYKETTVLPKPNFVKALPKFQMKIVPDSKIVFSSKLLANQGRKLATQKVTLTNTTNVRQTYKVKCTSNKLFRIRPSMGFCEVNQSVNIVITFWSDIIPGNGKRHQFSFYHMKCEERGKRSCDVWTPTSKPDGMLRLPAIFEVPPGSPPKPQAVISKPPVPTTPFRFPFQRQAAGSSVGFRFPPLPMRQQFTPQYATPRPVTPGGVLETTGTAPTSPVPCRMEDGTRTTSAYVVPSSTPV